MILRGLKVEGFRCFADAIEIGPFDERIQVIHAPNGTGKSTLFDALRTALFERHRVSGAKAEVIRPWGRDLAPTVTVEFAHGGEEYRLVKRFLSSPSCELLRREDGRFVRFAESDQADERVRALFTSSSFGRGFSGFDDCGPFEALWAPQDRLLLRHDLPDEIVGAIRESLGVQTAAPGTDALAAAIEAAWGEFYTPGGSPKKGKSAPRLARLEAERESLEAARREAQESLEKLEESQRRVEQYRAERDAAARAEASADAELRSVRARTKEYAEAAAARDLKKARAESAEGAWRALTERVEAIARVRKERAAAAAEAARVAEDLAAVSRERKAREAADAEAAKALREAASDRDALDAARAECDDAAALAEAAKAVAAAEGRLERLREAADALAKAKAERAGYAAPTDADLKAIRKARSEAEKARAHLDAASLHLSVELVEGGRVEVTAGDEVGSREVAAGEETTIRGAPEAALEIPGVAKVRARGPAGDAEEWREKLAAAEKRLAGLSSAHGTADLAELEARVERARRLDGAVDQAKARLDSRSEDGSEEEVAAARAQATSVRDGILARRPEWAEVAPDAAALREGIEGREREHRERLAAAESAREKAAADLAKVREREAGLKARDEAVRGRVADLANREEELAADAATEEERQKRLDELAMGWAAARAELVAAEERLGEIGDDPREEEGRLLATAKACRESAEKALEREKAEEGRLGTLAEAGAWSTLAEIEERLSELDREIRSEELRRDATDLLKRTVDECRAATVSAVADPVAAAATAMLERIAGSRLGRVRLSEGLVPAGVEPPVAGDGVDWSHLSGGEQEQLHLAVRLALGRLLAKEERQLVVLDDILTATDAGRLTRVLAVLEEASEHLQVVILTCHPERYAALPAAARFDLAAALTGPAR